MATKTPVVVHAVPTRHSIVFSRPGGRTVRASQGHLEGRRGDARTRGTLVGVNGVDLDEPAIQILLNHITDSGLGFAA